MKFGLWAFRFRLQETHNYADGWHSNSLDLSAACNRLGWPVYDCQGQGNPSDVSAGCAVVINMNNRNIKLKDN
jgi:hypothetical protein